MSKDYKESLNKLVQKKKKEIHTTRSDDALQNIFEILESTPKELSVIAKHFTEENSRKTITEGKRSFRETLIHILNIESLNYTTIYPAFLLDMPKVHPLHAERDINRLNLFENFTMKELLTAFEFERKKTLNFFRSLKDDQWSRKLIEQNKDRQETIYWRVRGLALHDYTHIHILKFQLELL